jgi:hypothetical protein
MAVIYAVPVLIGGIAGLYYRSPLLLGAVVGFVVPLIAGAVCFFARLHIRQSEGTLAGLVLAAWGWWLSVVFGLGYAAFYAATYFAVLQQADVFARQWFAKLSEGKENPSQVNAAFLQTMEPSVALGMDPKDEGLLDLRFNQAREMGMAGGLTQFREHQLVRLVQQAGSEAKVTPLGVRDWEYRGDGYRVRRRYRVSTPEGDYDVLLSVAGAESKDGQFEGRRWQVVWGETGIEKATPTPLAQSLEGMRQQARQFITNWTQKLIDGDLEDAYLDTCEPRERERLRRQYQHARLVFGALAAGAGPVQAGPVPIVAHAATLLDGELARELYFPPSYGQFKRGSLLKIDGFKPSDERTQTEVVEALKNFFRPVPERQRANLFLSQEVILNVQDATVRPWKVEQERLNLAYGCRVGMFRRYNCELVVEVESDPGPLNPERKPGWRALRLEARRAEDMSKVQRPGGPDL